MSASFRSLLAAGAVVALAASPAKAQLYVGAFAGATLLDQTVTVGGVKLVDLGADIFLGGLQVGWGHRFQSGLYLGAEAEGFLATGRARAMVNGVGYSYDVNAGLGVYGRVGWSSQPGMLFFARAGVFFSDTNYGWQTLPAVGVGAELPISNRWSARIDFTYAWNDVEYYIAKVGVVYSW